MAKKTIILTENQINRFFITENRESKNINLARRLLKSNDYTQEEANKVVDSLRTSIPNSRVADCKFLLGVTRMYINDELTSQDIISQINQTLKYIGNDTHVNEYNNDLNGENAETLIQRFSKNIEQDIEQDKQKLGNISFQTNNDYEIKLISSFEEASEYGKYTSWCVTHEEDMYNTYTNDGIKPFYFCLKHGFENVKEIEGENTPLDNYGLSMIAISVNTDGSLNTCTCRWNHDNDGNDNIMNTEQISHLFGQNFYTLFKPYTKEYVEQKLKEKREKYETCLNRVNNGESFDKVFDFVNTVNDYVKIVGISTMSDDMTFVYYNNGKFDYVRDDNNENPLMVINYNRLSTNLIYITTTEGVSGVYQIPEFKRIYTFKTVPTNVHMITLNQKSPFYNNLIIATFNEKSYVIDIKRNIISEPFNKPYIRFKTIKNQDILKVLGTDNTYFNLQEFKFFTKEGDNLSVKDTFEIYGKEMSVVVNYDENYNIYNNTDKKFIFDYWFKYIQVDKHNKIVIAYYYNDNSRIFTMESLFDNPINPIMFIPFINVKKDENNDNIYYLTTSTMTMVYDMNNRKIINIINQNNIQDQKQIKTDNKTVYIKEQIFNKLFHIQ